nr:PREDICTED: protein hunchback-like [Bemisia tabaci]
MSRRKPRIRPEFIRHYHAHQHQSRSHHSRSHHSDSHPSSGHRSRGSPPPHKKMELFTRKWLSKRANNKQPDNKQPAQTRLEGMRTKFRIEREPSPPPHQGDENLTIRFLRFN